MALPGLHPLRGDRKGAWAVSVSGNWRVTFTFLGKELETEFVGVQVIQVA
jgi:proteic killer suppression protein